MMKINSTFLFLLTSLSAAHFLFAEVKPASVFTDHAVLQRGKEVPIWGTAREGETVSVEIAGQTATTTAKDGRWMVRLNNLQQGGPYVLTIKGDNTLTLQDVLIGDVWICGGQSNMERQLGLRSGQQPIVDWEKEAATADFPRIRQFLVAQKNAATPQTETVGNWKVCTPQSVLNFTAVGFFFARSLHEKLQVPIGLIHASIGGTPAEAWMERRALEENKDLAPILQEQAKAEAEYPALVAKYQADESELLAKYQADLELSQKNGTPPPRKPGPPANPNTWNRGPGVLFNAMIAPLKPYAITGVIWYQGESNCGKPLLYRKLFPALIANWRQLWAQGDFPFLFVQLAPFRSNNPELREAQLLTLQSVANTAMVVTTDYGDANDIHPTNKKPVGERLALAARALAYGEKIEYSGPIFQDLKIENGNAVLSFTHTGQGLVMHGDTLRGFSIAGADKKFLPAQAHIEGEKVIVSSPEVAQPAAVRYGWSNVPDVNLYNADGLPASPFRTDTD